MSDNKENGMRISMSILLVFFIIPFCFAETIVLKSGNSIEGKIIEKTEKYIKIDFQGMPLTYFFDQIESIDGIKQILPLAKEQKSFQENRVVPYTSEEVITIIADDAHFLRADINNAGEPLVYKISPQKEINLDMSNYIYQCPKGLSCTEPNTIMVTLDNDKTYLSAMRSSNRIYRLNSNTMHPQIGSIPFQGFETGQEGAIILGYIDYRSQGATNFVALYFTLIQITE